MTKQLVYANYEMIQICCSFSEKYTKTELKNTILGPLCKRNFGL